MARDGCPLRGCAVFVRQGLLPMSDVNRNQPLKADARDCRLGVAMRTSRHSCRTANNDRRPIVVDRPEPVGGGLHQGDRKRTLKGLLNAQTFGPREVAYIQAGPGRRTTTKLGIHETRGRSLHRSAERKGHGLTDKRYLQSAHDGHAAVVRLPPNVHRSRHDSGVLGICAAGFPDRGTGCTDLRI